jgi:hypothetical protein
MSKSKSKSLKAARNSFRPQASYSEQFRQSMVARLQSAEPIDEYSKQVGGICKSGMELFVESPAFTLELFTKANVALAIREGYDQTPPVFPSIWIQAAKVASRKFGIPLELVMTIVQFCCADERLLRRPGWRDVHDFWWLARGYGITTHYETLPIRSGPKPPMTGKRGSVSCSKCDAPIHSRYAAKRARSGVSITCEKCNEKVVTVTAPMSSSKIRWGPAVIHMPVGDR